MGKAPVRRRCVYFLGAGFSSAFGLPTTEELLVGLPRRLSSRVGKAYEHFYPIESSGAVGFRPNVVDFFSVLQSHVAITRSTTSSAFPFTPLPEAATILRDLKREIARTLVRRTRNAVLSKSQAMEELLSPANVIVTSNWDPVIEAYALAHGHRLSYQRVPEQSNLVTLLKLHGSVDWLLEIHRKKARSSQHYASLRERRGANSHRLDVKKSDVILRTRTQDNLKGAWQRIGSRSHEPLLITMGPGKASELDPLRMIWNDAYWALSAARSVEFIGYSLPANDVEIRALILAGLQRGTRTAKLAVRNPSPDVHERFRTYIRRRFDENYAPFIV